MNEFTWEENEAFADIVCFGMKAEELARLEEEGQHYFSILDEAPGTTIQFFNISNDEGHIERGND